MADTTTTEEPDILLLESSPSTTLDFNFTSTTTSLSSQSKYCYPIDPYASDDTLVNVLFIVFLVLCLTAIIWRIISGVQMIRRYEGKIRILTSGPVLDASYFDNAPAAPANTASQKQLSPQQQQQPPKSQPEQKTPLLNGAQK